MLPPNNNDEAEFMMWMSLIAGFVLVYFIAFVFLGGLS